jgi:hypothetical protein
MVIDSWLSLGIRKLEFSEVSDPGTLNLESGRETGRESGREFVRFT